MQACPQFSTVKKSPGFGQGSLSQVPALTLFSFERGQAAETAKRLRPALVLPTRSESAGSNGKNPWPFDHAASASAHSPCGLSHIPAATGNVTKQHRADSPARRTWRMTMTLKLITAIAIGTLVASVIPAAAAPLSPSGGQSQATYDPSADQMVAGASSQNLVIPGDVAPADAWDRISGSLSTNGSDR
jgi:hypothetical protein